MMTECVFTNNSFAETGENIAITSDCGCVHECKVGKAALSVLPTCCVYSSKAGCGL